MSILVLLFNIIQYWKHSHWHFICPRENQTIHFCFIYFKKTYFSLVHFDHLMMVKNFQSNFNFNWIFPISIEFVFVHGREAVVLHRIRIGFELLLCINKCSKISSNLIIAENWFFPNLFFLHTHTFSFSVLILYRMKKDKEETKKDLNMK